MYINKINENTTYTLECATVQFHLPVEKSLSVRLVVVIGLDSSVWIVMRLMHVVACKNKTSLLKARQIERSCRV